jgi:hypothetical protein
MRLLRLLLSRLLLSPPSLSLHIAFELFRAVRCMMELELAGATRFSATL